MSGVNSLKGQIANPRSKIFRRCYIKRRMPITGLYESEWFEVSNDVVKWGNIKKEIDASKVNVFKFSGFNMTFSNREGKYNPNDDENSFWYGYGDQQRTLVRVKVGFISERKDSRGIWQRAEIPQDALYDLSAYDAANWDDNDGSVVFNGYMSGNIFINGTDQIVIPIVPLTEVFRQFAASKISGYTNSLTASGFITLLRDQVDSTGKYIFRPFFGDTTTNWVINSTSAQYTNLDTTTADDVKDATVWDIIEKLAGAENYVPYAGNLGTFNFVSRSYNNTGSSYSFFGAGGFSSEFGNTIKAVKKFGRVFTKYYSRVSLQYRQADTITSFSIIDSTFRVSPASAAWALGERTLELINIWIPTSTVADTIAQQLFDEYSALKTEIEFTTSLIPHLDLLQRVEITYDPTANSPQSLWDLYNWGDDLVPIQDEELLWDSSAGDALKMNARQFKLISIDVGLDTGECKFIGRE